MSSLGYDRDFRYEGKIAVEHGLANAKGKKVQYHTSILIFIGYLPLLLRLANLGQP